MSLPSTAAELVDVDPASHICWVIDDPATSVDAARALLCAASQANEKAVVLAPEGSALAGLSPLAAVSADPAIAVLDGGPLDPAAMFSMFRTEHERARSEGYRGLRVVADMDWLLRPAPSADEVVGFELQLDREVRRLRATIVCAYHRMTFTSSTIEGVRSVHPHDVSTDDPVAFRITAGERATWMLEGEVDVVNAEHLTSAARQAIGTGPVTIDVTALRFIDVAGMRAIAVAATRHTHPVRVVGASRMFRRSWELSGFCDVAPNVVLN